MEQSLPEYGTPMFNKYQSAAERELSEYKHKMGITEKWRKCYVQKQIKISDNGN